MSKMLSDYFKPGKAMVLVAVLLLGSMGLQIYILPSVLGLNTDGVVVEGTLVGVMLIFSYTLTTLGFLFLLMEYFNMKTRVKTYMKLTGQLGLPSEALEGKKPLVEPGLLIAEPKSEKPARKGLFSLGGGKKEPKQRLPKDPKVKPGLLSIFAKKSAAGEPRVKEAKPKKPGLSLPSFLKRAEKQKELKTSEAAAKPGLISRMESGKNAAEPVAVEKVIKKISVEAASLPPEKPQSVIESVKAPETVAPKSAELASRPEVVIQKAAEPTAPLAVRPEPVKSSATVADLLSGMNTLPKAKDEMTPQAGELKTVAELGDLAKSAAKPEPKADDILKAAAEEHAKNESKYNTVGVKLPAAEPVKPAIMLPPIAMGNDSEPTDSLQDSEFLKVLTDLRSVVDEMKAKKVNRS